MNYLIVTTLIPVILLGVPYFINRLCRGWRHSLYVAMLHVLIAMSIIYILIINSDYIDPPDGEMGFRILIPYIFLAIPIALIWRGISGYIENFNNNLTQKINK